MVELSENELSGFSFYLPDNLENFAVLTPPSGKTLEIDHDKVRMECSLESVPIDEQWYCCDEKVDDFFCAVDYAVENGLSPFILAPVNFGDNVECVWERKVFDIVCQNYSKFLAKGKSWMFHGGLDESGLVAVVLQNVESSGIEKFVQQYVDFLCWHAKRSLQKNVPNYKIDVQKLIGVLESYLGSDLSSIVQLNIEGFTCYNGHNKKKVFMRHADYVHALVQVNGCAFTYDDVLKSEAQVVVADKNNGVEKSRAIFEWIRHNITYDGETERQFGVEYRSALQTFRDKRGVCGEQASLQIIMERLVGEKAFYVKVDIDGEKHACCAHFTPDGRAILVDTTDDLGFDCKYSDFRIVSDEEASAGYD